MQAEKLYKTSSLIKKHIYSITLRKNSVRTIKQFNKIKESKSIKIKEKSIRVISV